MDTFMGTGINEQKKEWQEMKKYVETDNSEKNFSDTQICKYKPLVLSEALLLIKVLWPTYLNQVKILVSATLASYLQLKNIYTTLT